jgi:hypothetical protein
MRKAFTLMTMVGMGGACFQLSGCDQGIRTMILSGLNSATDTLLTSLTSALFTALDTAGNEDLTGGELTGGSGG